MCAFSTSAWLCAGEIPVKLQTRKQGSCQRPSRPLAAIANASPSPITPSSGSVHGIQHHHPSADHHPRRPLSLSVPGTLDAPREPVRTLCVPILPSPHHALCSRPRLGGAPCAPPPSSRNPSCQHAARPRKPAHVSLEGPYGPTPTMWHPNYQPRTPRRPPWTHRSPCTGTHTTPAFYTIMQARCYPTPAPGRDPKQPTRT